MASNLDDSGETVAKIRKDLACQICKDPARPGKKQWYRCMNLHQICQDCKMKSKKCSCGEPISKKYCKMTEELLSVKRLKLNCCYMKNGCQVVLNGSDLEEHASKCVYRLVPCLGLALNPQDNWGGKCDAKVTFKDAIQHFILDHAGETSLNKADLKVKNSMKANGFAHFGNIRPTMFYLNHQTFLLFVKKLENIVYFWVYIVGSPEEAKHFAYTLKLFGNEVTHTTEGKVAAIDESFDTLFNAGKCFAISHKGFIAQILDRTEEICKFEYSLEIRNLKEEAKDENYESGISDNDEDSEKSKK